MFLNSKFDGNIDNWNINNDTNFTDMFLDSPIEKYPPVWYTNFLSEGFDFNSIKKTTVHDKISNSIQVVKKKCLDVINDILNFKFTSTADIDPNIYNYFKIGVSIYKPKNDEEFRRLVRYWIGLFGYNCSLNWIDTSEITNMEDLLNEKFYGDISKWNVSNVTTMRGLFDGCTKFNCDISQWDVSKVTDFGCMFRNCKKFNQDLSNWDVSNVTIMRGMFQGSKFNGDIS
jgi:surface protein